MSEKHLHEIRQVKFVELGAVLAVREMVKRGLITIDQEESIDLNNKMHILDMHNPMTKTECGSVGCIGGYMGLLQGLPYPYHYVMECGKFVSSKDAASPALHDLFYPPVNSWYFTAKELIQAIDNWLENGRPRWEQIIRKRKSKAKRKPARRRRR